MGLFKKKISDEEAIQKNIAAQQAEIEAVAGEGKKDEDALGNSKLAVEITKLKAQIEGLNEQRKATNERFSHISEEIGELRGMIVDTNKGVTRIEAASTKAIDLVQSVKPEELMIEVRKLDSKIEALKANLESNETLMQDSMKELKELRRKMDFYKGAEQIAKLNEEVKKELIDIKKSESVIERHSNKVESIFIDVEKKFIELDKFSDVSKELHRSFEKLQGDVDKLRVKTEDSVEKKEFVKLITKFNDFEKHTTSILNLIDEKTRSNTESINREFNKIARRADERVSNVIKKLKLSVDETEAEKKKPEEIDIDKAPSKKKFSLKGVFSKKPKYEPNKEESKEEESENEE